MPLSAVLGMQWPWIENCALPLGHPSTLRTMAGQTTTEESDPHHLDSLVIETLAVIEDTNFFMQHKYNYSFVTNRSNRQSPTPMISNWDAFWSIVDQTVGQLGEADAKELTPTESLIHDLLAIIKGFRNGLVYGAKIRFPHALVMTFLFRNEP